MRLPIRTDSERLLKLVRHLNGWQNLAVRSLGEDTFDVVLTTKQIQKLGKEAIKELYEQAE